MTEVQVRPLRETGNADTRCCRWAGLMLWWATRGVSIEGEEKKKRLGVTSELSEIWDRAIFQSVPFTIKSGKNRENRRGRKRQSRDQVSEEVVLKTAYLAFSCARRISRDQRCVCTSVSALVRARACVFTSVWTSARNEGRRRIKPRKKEGWWTIQAVVRHKWWVVFLLGFSLHFPDPRQA